MDIQALLEKLQKIDELKLKELVELHAQLKEAFNKVRAGEIEGVEPDDIGVLKDLAKAAEKANDRAVELQVDQADVDAEIEKLSEAFKAEDSDPSEGDDDGKSDGNGEEVPDEEKESEANPQPGIQQPGDPNPQGQGQPDKKEEDDSEEIVVEKEIKVPSLASLNAAAKKQQQRVTVKQPAKPQYQMRRNSLGDITFISPEGKEMDATALADTIIKRRDAFGRNIKDGDWEKISLATIKLEVPDDRYLKSEQDIDNLHKVDQVTADGMYPEMWQDEGLIASGGWCAPLEAEYGIEVIAEAHRPVRDSLPRFGADRGGIRLRRGIGIGSGAAAIDSWTNAIDQTPAGNTKDLLTVSCDTIHETVLRAVTKRVQFGNFRARADREGVAAWLQVVDAAHARRAEQLLLDDIDAIATDTTTSNQIGAARDLLVNITYAAAGVRSRNRLRPDARIRVLLPQWVPDMISADLTRGLQSDPSFLGVTAADVTQWLAARNVNAAFYADQLTGENPWQIFPTQAAGALNDFPGVVTWFFYPEGSFLFLDGGELDLGIVRDSTLNGTNDYQLFAETFEAVAFRGVEAFKVDSTVCVNGESSGGTDQNALCNS